MTTPPRLALVGDRSRSIKAHTVIPEVVDFLNRAPADPVEIYWLESSEISGTEDLQGFAGAWVVPGSPYRSSEGVLAAVQAAREGGVPFLGTCGGFQHLLLEYARNVCGITSATHGEVQPGDPTNLIIPLSCSLLGEEGTVHIEPGTVAASAMGAGRRTERYFCRFGLAEQYEPMLSAKGLVVSGRDSNGEARVAELPGHPFFVGALFQPELSSGNGWAHPLIAAFVTAVRAAAVARV
ncbi:MAG TPA: hypothetical protein VFN61_13185 [Acidimicrobiales bacterium]|nr:hypothetical protein [Acidimicrobiales bacterium]